MSANTSNESIYKYRKKTYSQWNIQVRKEDFAIVEEIRAKTGLSRLEFFKYLVTEKYGNVFDKPTEE